MYFEGLTPLSPFLKMLAGQTGQLVNYSELSSGASISLPTLKDYLWYAEKTFTVNRLLPYFKNARSEIIKSPVIYFNDLGMRNYLSGVFGSISQPRDFSFVFQNLVFNILKNQLDFSGAGLHFWRTKDRAEVDFIVDYGKQVFPVEVKYRKLNQPEASRSLRNFLEKYQPLEALVVNLDLDSQLLIGKTKVCYLPFWKLAGKIKEILST